MAKKTPSANQQPRRAKGGRPKGAKTRNLPVAIELPAKCPRCQSTRRTRKSNQRSHRRPMTHAAGGRCYVTTWSQVQCLECGQLYRIRTTKEIPAPKPDAATPGGATA